MPSTGTRGGRQIPKIASYQKSKQLPQVTDGVDVEASAAHDSEVDSKEESEEEEEKKEEEGAEKGKNVGAWRWRIRWGEEGEKGDSEKEESDKGSNEKKKREEERSGEGEEDEAEEREEEGREKKKREMMKKRKLRKKGHVARHVARRLHQRVRRASDVVHEWKLLSASESNMTSAEKMEDDVFRHLTGKGSATSCGLNTGLNPDYTLSQMIPDPLSVRIEPHTSP
ncbi:hypothetical protein Syun_021684 [Stephania yunnanensis]|uniref:Uncharacterized protein n=1 Tax=Stephania yunnanensis TaxID=152371 RepID=A0AAP0IHZ9_9MAGN